MGFMLHFCIINLLMFLWTPANPDPDIKVILTSTGPGRAAETECKVSTYGKEFIFGFVDLPSYNSHAQATDPKIDVQLITQHSANVYISLPSTNSANKTPTTVTTKYYVYKSKIVPFNSSFINKNQDTSSGGVIKITSDAPVTVIKVYTEDNDHIVCPVLPSSAVSTSYVIPSYGVNANSYSKAQLFVAALNDSTTVTFEGFETGSMIQTLNQNEIYTYQSRADLSGTIVTSNNPVAIISSVTFGTSRYYNKLQERLIIEAPPVDRHARHFIIPVLRANTEKIIRIYAPFQHANVEIHSTSDTTKYVTVYQKIFYEIVPTSATVLEILSDSPVVIVRIDVDSPHGAFSMTNIPAVSQFLNSYPVDISYTSSRKTDFTVIIQYNKASGLLVNDKPIIHNPDQTAIGTPLGNFTFLTIRPSSLPATISHIASEPFGLFYTSSNYFYSAGMQFTKSDCSSVSPSIDPSTGFIG